MMAASMRPFEDHHREQLAALLTDNEIGTLEAEYATYAPHTRQSRNETPYALRERLLRTANAIDRAVGLVRALPRHGDVPAEAGYGMTRLAWRTVDGRRTSARAWADDGVELAMELRSGARDIDTSSKPRPGLDDLKRAIGTAIFLSTRDVSYRHVRAVLAILSEVPPCLADDSGTVVTSIQALTGAIHVGPGLGGPAAIRDIAPALRTTGQQPDE